MIYVTNQNFGLLIALVRPEFILLWGLLQHSAMITGWLGHVATEVPSVGGFLYITMATGNELVRFPGGPLVCRFRPWPVAFRSRRGAGTNYAKP